MSKQVFIFFIFCLCFGLPCKLKAQILLPDNKIPKDFVITYETYGRCYVKLKIGANRKLLMEKYDCRQLLEPEFSRYESMKRYKRIPKAQLKQLIYEFEKINFFNLNDEYSYRKGNCTTFVTDSGSVRFSLQMNGKSKKIYFENGCLNEKDMTVTKLKNLAEKIYQIQNEVKYTELKK